MINERTKLLNEIKSKPFTGFCTCGLEGKEIFTCNHESCKEDLKHQKHVNNLVDRGWLPIERWKHTEYLKIY